MAKIGKKEFVENIAKELDIPKTEAQSVIDKAIEKIIEEVKEGNEVAFLGFGTFKERINKAKEGINPKTKEKIQISASKTIAFKVSPKLKEKI